MNPILEYIEDFLEIISGSIIDIYETIEYTGEINYYNKFNELLEVIFKACKGEKRTFQWKSRYKAFSEDVIRLPLGEWQQLKLKEQNKLISVQIEPVLPRRRNFKKLEYFQVEEIPKNEQTPDYIINFKINIPKYVQIRTLTMNEVACPTGVQHLSESTQIPINGIGFKHIYYTPKKIENKKISTVDIYKYIQYSNELELYYKRHIFFCKELLLRENKTLIETVIQTNIRSTFKGMWTYEFNRKWRNNNFLFEQYLQEFRVLVYLYLIKLKNHEYAFIGGKQEHDYMISKQKFLSTFWLTHRYRWKKISNIRPTGFYSIYIYDKDIKLRPGEDIKIPYPYEPVLKKYLKMWKRIEKNLYDDAKYNYLTKNKKIYGTSEIYSFDKMHKILQTIKYPKTRITVQDYFEYLYCEYYHKYRFEDLYDKEKNIFYIQKFNIKFINYLRIFWNL